MKIISRLVLLAAILAANALFAESEKADGESVDIGNGRKMYLECQGTGSPTVVFVSGRSDRATIWHTHGKSSPDIFAEVAKFTKACAYDRPGTITIADNRVIPSRSTSVAQPTTPKNAVADLHALLTAAKIPGPYVLVGHSYGGLIVRLYASTYPSEVSGMVLVDVLTELLYDALTPPQQALWIRLNSNYSKELDSYTVQEKIDLETSFDQLRNAPPMRQMPVIVLTSDQQYDFRSLIAAGILPADAPVDFAPIVFQTHLNAQKRLTEMLHAKSISKTHAGHYIQREQPQLVLEAIKEVVEKVRKEKKS